MRVMMSYNYSDGFEIVQHPVVGIFSFHRTNHERFFITYTTFTVSSSSSTFIHEKHF